jgi:hypothetical protein
MEPVSRNCRPRHQLAERFEVHLLHRHHQPLHFIILIRGAKLRDQWLDHRTHRRIAVLL